MRKTRLGGTARRYRQESNPRLDEHPILPGPCSWCHQRVEHTHRRRTLQTKNRYLCIQRESKEGCPSYAPISSPRLYVNRIARPAAATSLTAPFVGFTSAH